MVGVGGGVQVKYRIQLNFLWNGSSLFPGAGHVGKQLQVTVAAGEQEGADEILEVLTGVNQVQHGFLRQSEWAQVSSCCNKASVWSPSVGTKLGAALGAFGTGTCWLLGSQSHTRQQSAEFLSAVKSIVIACYINYVLNIVSTAQFGLVCISSHLTKKKFSSNRIHPLSSWKVSSLMHYDPFSWNILAISFWWKPAFLSPSCKCFQKLNSKQPKW